MGVESPIAREENEILIINFKNERTMKKYLFSALAMGLVLTSCQSDEPFAPGAGEEVQASFTISVPDAMGTRAAGHSSAEGGYSNGAGQLNYTVALLNQENKVMYSATSAGNGTSATFSPTVVQGYTYKILAYATFDNAVAAPTVGQTIADTDAINNIATLKGINDESEDAYFCNATIVGAPEMSATLKRPFGKLRLVAEDYDKLHDLGLEVANVKVTYGGAVVMNTQFNASTKAFKGKATSKVFEFAGETSYSEEANKDTNGVYTVFTDYLPAGETDETMYPFTIVTTYTNGETYTRTFAQDIPVKRNYLTTLRGNFFTTEAALTLTVNEMFATELDAKYTYFTVDTNDELKAALTSNHEHIYVELDADLAVDVTAWETLAFGGDKTKSITINGEQVVTRGATPTLTFNNTNSDWNNIATKNGAKLILKNLNVTNSGRNDGPWNRHDLNFACDVEMENVVSDKAIALKAGGVLKNVTIEDKNTSDTYALWIQPKGQVVTLEGCTINMPAEDAGRGIKIDEQYVDEVKAPTLNVSGTTFKTEEKAAVLVKSVDGAIINWGEGNNISGVKADSTFAVWVDEDAAAYADKVIVNGTNKTVEGKSAVAKSDAEISTAIKNGKTSIVLTAGTYVIPAAAQGKTLTFVGTGNPEDVKIATNQSGSYEGCNYALDGSTVVFENITITTDGKTYTGYARCKATFKNCIINNCLTLYDDCTFEDCTLNVSGDQYNVWTWGAKNALFKNCTFKSDGKALLYYQEGTNVVNVKVDSCKFYDNGGLTDLKAAIEIGDAPYGATPTYNLTVSNTQVFGYEINNQGINTGTTLWANKNSMPTERLNVIVDGVDVY